MFLPNLLSNKKTSSQISSLKWTFCERLNILRFSVASMAVFIPTDKLSTLIKHQSEFRWKSKYMFLNSNWKKSKVNSNYRSKKIRLPDLDDIFSWEKIHLKTRMWITFNFQLHYFFMLFLFVREFSPKFKGKVFFMTLINDFYFLQERKSKFLIVELISTCQKRRLELVSDFLANFLRLRH